jgi:type I restriction enzyme, S subunit
MSGLPPGWVENSLSRLMDGGLFIDGDWVETKDQDENGEIRLTQLADVGEGYWRNRSNRSLTRDSAARLSCTYLEVGDVLVARMPDPLGRACIFPGDPRQAITVVDVCILRPPSGSVSPKWLMWFINSPPMRARIEALQSGTTRRRISRKNFGSLTIPVPPLDEQRRIAEVIEEQFSRLDAAEASLARGLRRIGRLADAIATAVANGSGVPRRICEMGHVVTGNTPSTKKSDYWGGSLPFVTPGDLQHGGRVRSARRSISQSAMRVARTVPARSVLVTCIGATIGKTSVSEIDCAINQQINAIVPDPAVVLPEYLLAVVSGPDFQRKIHERASSTTLPILSKAKFSDLSLKVPPLEVQQRLMLEYGELSSVRGSVEVLIERAVHWSYRLRSAILARAFAGKLVPRDQHQEPMSLPSAAPQGGRVSRRRIKLNGVAQVPAESEVRS